MGINGWAIESRVYAEDPSRNFLPSIGRLVYYRPPGDDEHVRVDTGVYEGGEVSMYYDPMIAKLITYGANREEAIAHMRLALDRFVIRGVSSNLSFLSALMEHPKFVSGNMSTNLIGEEYPDGFQPIGNPHSVPTIMISVAASMARHYRDRAARIAGQLDGYRRNVPHDWVVVMNDEQHPVSVKPVQGGFDVKYNGDSFAVRSDWQFGQHIFSGTINGEQIFVQVQRDKQNYHLSHGSSQADISIVTPRAAELLKYMPVKVPPDMSGYLLSPMPGLLVSLAVKEGDTVNEGEELAVLEAMKMENTLLAERDCVVTKINYAHRVTTLPWMTKSWSLSKNSGVARIRLGINAGNRSAGRRRSGREPARTCTSHHPDRVHALRPPCRRQCLAATTDAACRQFNPAGNYWCAGGRKIDLCRGFGQPRH